MGDGRNSGNVPTRRETIRCGGAVVAGGLRAGCSGFSSNDQTGSATATEDTSYTVNIQPTGDVTFEHPPESAVANSSNYGDMLAALQGGTPWR